MLFQRTPSYFAAVFLYFALGGAGTAQVSSSAYRALGQPDLRQNSINMVQGLEMYAPSGIALDFRDGALHLYVSDTRNNRVLAWQDARSSQIGDPATLVLGQPSPQRTTPLGIGVKGFSAPLGLAVDPTNGNLYVADVGNNRVLRFPNPFANPSRIEPDAVYGQLNFSSGSANPFGISNSSLSQPRALAFDSSGNLWVADTGNNRVVRFNAAVLDTPTPQADLVLGQKDLNSGAPNRGGQGITASGFDMRVPSTYDLIQIVTAGLAFDPQGNLYVSDFSNTRVLKFAAPVGFDQAATTVFGEADFNSRGVPIQPSASTLAGPGGLSVDGAGSLYVAVPFDNRILAFAPTAASGANANSVLGQVSFTGTQPNPSAFPYASASTFAGAADVKTDPDGNVFVADTRNNRVLSFPANSKSANRLWGQIDFSSNGVNQIKPGSVNFPDKMAIDYSQAPYPLYVSDTNNHRILIWKDAVRFRTGDPADLVIGQRDLQSALPNADGGISLKPSRTSLFAPRGIAVDASGNLYVADSGNNRVLRFPNPTGQSGRIAPDAVLGQPDFTSSASAAVNASALNRPAGVAVGPDEDLFVADSGNNRVLEFPSGAATGTAAIRVYGQPSFNTGVLPSAVSAQTLVSPQGIFVDPAFTLYVADFGANRVLVFPDTKDAPASGATASIVIGQGRFDSAAAGTGSAGLKGPIDVTLDSQGNVYVADNGNNRVVSFPSLLFLPLAGASATSVVGQHDLTGTSPNWDSLDGQATPEGLFGPVGLYMDRMDTLYVGDTGNNRVLHFLQGALIVNAATPQAGAPLAQGGLVSIYGNGLSSSSDQAPSMPWPLSLANREVAINDGATAPVSVVGPSQINFQMPSASPTGAVRVAVRAADTSELLAGGTISVAAASPGLFTSSGDGTGQGQILNQDGTTNSPSNAAARGSVIKIFGTGQGPVSPPVADGAAAPADPLANTVAVPTSDGRACLTQQPSVCVAIGSSFGDIQFSGLAPGSVGTWQITVKIPSGALTGSAVPLRAVINGVPSNIVSVAVK